MGVALVLSANSTGEVDPFLIRRIKISPAPYQGIAGPSLRPSRGALPEDQLPLGLEEAEQVGWTVWMRSRHRATDAGKGLPSGE